MINFVKYRRWYFLFSALIILAGIAAMVISTRTYAERSIVRLSIDFVGGTLFQVRFERPEGAPEDVRVSSILGSELEEVFAGVGLSDVTAQRIGVAESGQWQVRTSFLGQDAERLTTLNDGLSALAASKGLNFDRTFFEENLSTVSPAVGGEATTAAVVATGVASLLVLSWIAFAFRAVKRSWRYGISALLAMVHDVLVIMGAMSIFGLLFGWEADALFLTAVLTVVGYSVQDTIVVFDRIRENAARRRGEPYELIVNRSIMETVQRSLMTQIAVAFMLVAQVLITTGPIRQFIGVLLVGLLSGTYSSLFTAIPLLVAWEQGEFPFNLFRRRQAHPATA